MASMVCVGESYSYDADGQLTGVSYDNGLLISYEYDGRGNITRRQVAGFQPQVRIEESGATLELVFEKPIEGRYEVLRSQDLSIWEVIQTSSGTGTARLPITPGEADEALFFRVRFQ